MVNVLCRDGYAGSNHFQQSLGITKKLLPLKRRVPEIHVCYCLNTLDSLRRSRAYLNSENIDAAGDNYDGQRKSKKN